MYLNILLKKERGFINLFLKKYRHWKIIEDRLSFAYPDDPNHY